jgi:D-alanine-D-alanine ligase
MNRWKAPQNVLVLFNASGSLIKGEPEDLLAEQGVIACAEAIAQALKGLGLRVDLAPIRDDVESALAPFPPHQWTVFNLGEGLAGRLFEEARIAWALEAMGYCFTGSGGEAIARSVDKARGKEALLAHGVATPAWRLFRHPDEVETLGSPSPFPVIVKPVAEDASVGVGPEAVVRSRHALRERVDYIVTCYRQSALAEEFIPGREFNISVWDDPPRTLPLAEIDFSAISSPHARIVSFAAKWQPDSFEYNHTPVICPAQVESGLGADIQGSALRAWRAIGCRGYARIDMRVRDDYVPYVVEVNCNPDLSPDAGFYRAAHANGFSYSQMALRILEIAWRQFYVEDRPSAAERRSIDHRDNGQGRSLQPGRGEVRRGDLARVSS